MQISKEILESRLNMVSRTMEALASELNAARSNAARIEQELTLLSGEARGLQALINMAAQSEVASGAVIESEGN